MFFSHVITCCSYCVRDCTRFIISHKQPWLRSSQQIRITIRTPLLPSWHLLSKVCLYVHVCLCLCVYPCVCVCVHVQACVLSTLLYGRECWTPLRCHLKRLDSFHQQCIKAVLGVTNKQQWEQYITLAMVRQRWGDMEVIATKLRRRSLEWLGHVARMAEYRLLRFCLFGWLAQVRPFHGPKLRWRDLVKSDLQSLGIGDGCWYDQARDRRQ